MSGVYITPTSTLAKFTGAVEKAHARPTHAFLHHDDYELLMGRFRGQLAQFDGPITVYGVQVSIGAVARGKLLLAIEADLEYE